MYNILTISLTGIVIGRIINYINNNKTLPNFSTQISIEIKSFSINYLFKINIICAKMQHVQMLWLLNWLLKY